MSPHLFDDSTRAGFELYGAEYCHPLSALKYSWQPELSWRPHGTADGSILLTDFSARTGGICRPCLDVSGDAYCM